MFFAVWHESIVLGLQINLQNVRKPQILIHLKMEVLKMLFFHWESFLM